MITPGHRLAWAGLLLPILGGCPVFGTARGISGVDIGVLGGVSMLGMTMPTVWHGVYTLEGVRVPVIMLFAIVFASVLYPAAKAAFIRPVEAMHHQ